MADTNISIESLKAELNTLRSEMANLVKSLESKKGEFSADAAEKIAKELHHYRNLASSEARQLYEQGQAGLDEVGDKVRNNPIASLAIAFGAGCVLSCLFRHLK